MTKNIVLQVVAYFLMRIENFSIIYYEQDERSCLSEYCPIFAETN